jgi:hypothetical protein
MHVSAIPQTLKVAVSNGEYVMLAILQRFCASAAGEGHQ